jgi:hypothetical protein
VSAFGAPRRCRFGRVGLRPNRGFPFVSTYRGSPTKSLASGAGLRPPSPATESRRQRKNKTNPKKRADNNPKQSGKVTVARKGIIIVVARRHALTPMRRHVSALGVHVPSEGDTGSPGSDGASPYLFNRARYRSRSRNRFAILAGENETEKRRHAPRRPASLADPPIRFPQRPTPTRGHVSPHASGFPLTLALALTLPRRRHVLFSPAIQKTRQSETR